MFIDKDMYIGHSRENKREDFIPSCPITAELQIIAVSVRNNYRRIIHENLPTEIAVTYGKMPGKIIHPLLVTQAGREIKSRTWDNVQYKRVC
jgi:hypothetical protein